MEIRILTPNQAAFLHPLQHQTPSRNWSVSEAKEFLHSDWVQGFGLFKDTALIGMCLIRVIEDEVEILELAIDKAHRQKGGAKKLWGHIKETFPKASFFLEVSEQNIPAITFYQKIGFIRIHRRENYYGPGSHALIYKL